MKLILIRHGETKFNKLGKIISFTDAKLNDTGEKQAELISKKLKNVIIDEIHSSPLIRAYNTAEKINKYHKKNIKKNKLITERNFGKFEKSEYKKLNLKKIYNNNLYHKFEMEHPKEFEKRIEKFIEETFKKYENKTILIVSHSGTIKMLLYKLLNIQISFEEFRKQINKTNGSISTIKLDENLRIISKDIANENHLKIK